MHPMETILENFKRIAAIPRPTGHEERMRAWLQEWAAQRGFSSQADAAGNLVIRAPATPGYADQPVHVLQGHMDMVCEKTSDSAHDFLRDPITCIREGDWLHADRTTLGADNGIAMAIALTLVEDRSLAHPPLELLFTVEEEVGIRGASQLDPGLISGKILINLDSDEDGTFIIGCAGGKTTRLNLPVLDEPIGQQARFLLTVSGLQGGHSGVDIHKHRGNAIRLVARALDHLQQSLPLQIGRLAGGTAHNAIPRQAEATFTCPQEMAAACTQQVAEFEQTLQQEYAPSDPDLRLGLCPADDSELKDGLSVAQSRQIVQLLMALPDGVAELSAVIPGFVETSNNLATVQMVEHGVQITSSQRSTSMSRLGYITRRIDAVAHLAGAQVAHSEGYPAWQPNNASALVQKSVQVYQQQFGQAPEVKLIHAGLECGIIGERCGGMDMISLGPTIHNAHSPNETLYLPSVEKVWRFLAALLRLC